MRSSSLSHRRTFSGVVLTIYAHVINYVLKSRDAISELPSWSLLGLFRGGHVDPHILEPTFGHLPTGSKTTEVSERSHSSCHRTEPGKVGSCSLRSRENMETPQSHRRAPKCNADSTFMNGEQALQLRAVDGAQPLGKSSKEGPEVDSAILVAEVKRCKCRRSCNHDLPM